MITRGKVSSPLIRRRDAYHITAQSKAAALTLVAAKVFGVAELLEGILVHVSINEILHQQRVSRQWQAVIKGCKKIQLSLGFEAMEDFGDYAWAHFAATGGGISFRLFTANISAHDFMRDYDGMDAYFNPMLKHFFSPKKFNDEYMRYDSSLKYASSKICAPYSPCYTMYLVRPPSNSVDFKLSEGPESVETGFRSIYKAEGVTVGDVGEYVDREFKPTRRAVYLTNLRPAY